MKKDNRVNAELRRGVGLVAGRTKLEKRRSTGALQDAARGFASPEFAATAACVARSEQNVFS